MAEYQRNADAHYGGNIDGLIADLHAEPAHGIQEIGDKLTRDRAREREMQAGLAILEHGTLVQKLWYLGPHPDRELVCETWMAYPPSPPPRSEARSVGNTCVRTGRYRW